MPPGSRAPNRLAVALAMLPVLLVATLWSGLSYAFCRTMDRAADGCCAQAGERRDAAEKGCCETRAVGSLPLVEPRQPGPPAPPAEGAAWQLAAAPAARFFSAPAAEVVAQRHEPLPKRMVERLARLQRFLC